MISIQKFKLSPESVDLHLENGNWATVYFNNNTGKPIYRKKTGIWASTEIKHEGIMLGVTTDGTQYVMHNHITEGRTAVITSYADFAKTKEVYYSEKRCTKSKLAVISDFLNQVIRKEPYTVQHYNCQDAVNQSCSGMRKSEDVNRLLKKAAFVGGGALLLFLILFGWYKFATAKR